MKTALCFDNRLFVRSILLMAVIVAGMLNGCSRGGGTETSENNNKRENNESRESFLNQEGEMKDNVDWNDTAGFQLLVSKAIAAGELKRESLNLDAFNLQGHRGARGLVPENTIASFVMALEYGVQTIECDLVVSRDLRIVVSHEPWMSHKYCSFPDGKPVTKSSQGDLITYWMDYDSIRRFDCGMRGNPKFPEQQPMPSYKPLMVEMFDAVDSAAVQMGRPVPAYNLEIKSKHSWDGVMVPKPAQFVELMLEELNTRDVAGRSNIQSFDARILQEVHEHAPEIPLALLVDDASRYEEQLQELGFDPMLFSPDYRSLNAEIVEAMHRRGLKVIPWTVNEPADMLAVIAMGVDGLITDYPNRAALLFSVLNVE